MSEPFTWVIEVVGTSSVSIEEALKGALAHATQADRNIAWFEIV
jgi:flavin-binding protein dodecin